MISKGDQVSIKPQWRDKGDGDYVWVALEDEDGGRVVISPLGTGLAFPPCYRVPVDQIESMGGVDD